MRILFDSHVLGKNKTGIERYCKNLATYLLIQKKVNLFLYTGKGNLKKSIVKDILHHKSVSTKLSFYKPFADHGLYRIISGFHLAASTIKPDILHVNYFTPLIKTCPIVNTIHDICFKLTPKKTDLTSKLSLNAFIKISLSNSDIIITPSRKVKNDLIRHYLVNPGKIKVINHASDDAFYHIDNKFYVYEYIYKEFTIQGKYFLIVGNVDMRKQTYDIIDVFKNLNRNNQNIKLVFAGPNLLSQQVNRKYNYLIDHKKILFLNYVSDHQLNMLYNRALALVYYSHCEGFGIPLVEAIRCKTPVICPKIQPYQEIMDSSAIYVKNNSELLYWMNQLATDPKAYKYYSKLSFQRDKYFSWDAAAKKTFSIYKELINT